VKQKTIYPGILFFIICLFYCRAQENDYPILKGPYLGQKPPGITPEIFAPGIISTTNHLEFSGTFTPDGKIMYFNSNRPFPGFEGERRPTQIWFMERMCDGWGEPKHLCEGMFVTSSENGNVYLNSGVTRLENGRFVPFQEIVGALNTPLRVGNEGGTQALPRMKAS